MTESENFHQKRSEPPVWVGYLFLILIIAVSGSTCFWLLKYISDMSTVLCVIVSIVVGIATPILGTIVLVIVGEMLEKDRDNFNLLRKKNIAGP